MSKKYFKDIKEYFPEEPDNLDVTFHRENQFLDWERAEILFENRLIPTQQGTYMELNVVKNSSYNIFEMEWAIFDDICYINWIKIDREYRRKGISSKIRKEVIEFSFSQGCREIFTLPASVAGEKLATSQGFEKTHIQPDESEFTVYSLTR